MENNDTICCVTLYYDEYEYFNGDGFFPQIDKDATCCKEIEVKFIYNNIFNCWIQKTGICISGLDGDNESKLLNILNSKHNLNGNYIANVFGYKIYKKIQF